ncbi:MAG: putative sensor domain DACNV-containing protein [Thermodesulfovibrionales bacterium]
MKESFHAYPRELVSFIFDRCEDPLFMTRFSSAGIGPSCEFPDRSVLEHLISTCYQASLMREEERPVIFRLIIRDHHLFPPDDGPPIGLHRLQFSRMRPFNEHELSRLAPAADFYRALIGVTLDRQEGAQIWGIVHSGTRWMQPVSGGTKAIPALPWSPVIHVTGPGRISVSMGPEMIASLNNGQIGCPSLDIFSAPWFAESFASTRAELWETHEAARSQALKPWAALDPKFARFIAQQGARRIISLIRNSRHGGMLVYLPTEMGRDISAMNRHISLKYQFQEEEPRQRFLTLILRIMNSFAELHGEEGHPAKVVGWQEFVCSRSEEIALFDEAMFDLAHFIAALSAIDGAVVMTKRQDLLGFGGVISGEMDGVETITHALDLEGRLTQQEPVEEGGTRHRAAYRLCQGLHDALVVVISQDGDARFVKWHEGSVTYWDLASTGAPGF